MATTPKATLKNWFKVGLKPLETQFAAWMDSYWHKDETSIPITSINGLEDVLNDLDTVAARDAAIAAAVTGLWDDRGNFDASIDDTFPSSGGSGAAGAILKGDIWTVSVDGTIDGEVVQVGDTVRAIADTPGQDGSNWAIGENNIGYVPENVTNKATDFSTVNNTLYPTTQAVATYVASLSGSSKFNSLIAADNTNTINNANYTQEWQWNTLSASGLKLTSTSTAASGNAQALFEVNLSGANVNSTQTTYAGRFINTHTGTGAINIGGYFTASGGATNYAIQTGGDVFILGSVSTSATNSLTIQNAAGRNMLSIRNDGFITFGSTLTPISLAIGKTTSYFASSTSTSGISIFTPTNVSDASLNIFGFNTYNHTTGTGKALSLAGNFVPTSGTAAFNYLDIPVTINQTGGANGPVKFVSIYPTLTAANDVTAFDYNPTVTSVAGTHLAFRATSGNFLLGGTTITTGSVLMDLQSPSRALLLTRISDNANITTKVNAMHWYNSTDHKYYGHADGSTVRFLTNKDFGGQETVDNYTGYVGGALSTAVYQGSDLSDGDSIKIEVRVVMTQSSGTAGATAISFKLTAGFRKSGGTLTQVGASSQSDVLNDTGDSFVGTPDLSVSAGAVVVGLNLTTSKTFKYSYHTKIYRN